MVEIKSEILIDSDEVATISAEDAELLLKERIGREISKNILKNVDDIVFLDVEPESRGFKVTSNLVVCSMSSIVTAIEQMAKKLAEYDLEEKEIEDILTVITKNSHGW